MGGIKTEIRGRKDISHTDERGTAISAEDVEDVPTLRNNGGRCVVIPRGTIGTIGTIEALIICQNHPPLSLNPTRGDMCVSAKRGYQAQVLRFMAKGVALPFLEVNYVPNHSPSPSSPAHQDAHLSAK